MTTIRTPDQRLRVFISSTLKELAGERAAAHAAVERLRLTPVMFELGARPHPPRELYRSYLEQSDVFVGIYWQSYGWVAPGEQVSGLEDEFRASTDLPRLVYIKTPAPQRDEGLQRMLDEIRSSGLSYRRFAGAEELEDLLADDLALLVSERFTGTHEVRRTPPPRTSGLRSDPDRFVGRRQSLSELDELLTDPTVRIVTITGPGGVGKTRLAREVVRRALGRFPAGAHFVELAATSTRDDVTSAIAAAPGVADAAGTTVIEQVAAALSGGASLLVLDNAEHVIDAVAPVAADLVALAPELTLLVTSRELLRVSGEHVVDLPPLDLPVSDVDGDVGGRAESIELFLDRVRAVRRGFRASDEDLRAAAEIVRRLDGLPLAIELAAARSRLLAPAEILVRLGSRLDLPGAAPRDAPARQGTLRDAIRWSYDLMPAGQRDVFDHLGVFVGGFGLDSVDDVSPRPTAGDSTLDVLADLADRSLVRTDGSAGGVLRFQMLETIREFARERLRQRGEWEAAGHAHAAHFLRLAEDLEPLYESGAEQRVLARSAADHANFMTAGDWFVDHGQPEAAVRMAEVLWRSWWARSRYREGITRMRGLRTSAPELSDHDRARVLHIEGQLSFGLSDFGRALPLVSEAYNLYQAVGDRRGTAQALVTIGVIEAATGHPAGEQRLAAAVALSQQVDDSWTVAFAELAFGSILVQGDRFEEAIPHLEVSVRHNRQLGTEVLLAYSLNYLGRALLGVDQIEEASTALGEALERGESMGSREVVSRTLTELAGLAARRADAATAAQVLGLAAATRDSIGAPTYLPDQPYVAELSAVLTAELGPRNLEESTERGRRSSIDEVRALLSS